MTSITMMKVMIAATLLSGVLSANGVQASAGTALGRKRIRHLGQRHLDNKTTGGTCWCLVGNRWFYDWAGTKPMSDIVKQLRTANSRNANFLLNVGTDKGGRTSVKVLSQIGRLLWNPQSGSCDFHMLLGAPESIKDNKQ